MMHVLAFYKTSLHLGLFGWVWCGLHICAASMNTSSLGDVRIIIHYRRVQDSVIWVFVPLSAIFRHWKQIYKHPPTLNHLSTSFSLISPCIIFFFTYTQWNVFCFITSVAIKFMLLIFLLPAPIAIKNRGIKQGISLDTYWNMLTAKRDWHEF